MLYKVTRDSTDKGMHRPEQSRPPPAKSAELGQGNSELDKAQAMGKESLPTHTQPTPRHPANRERQCVARLKDKCAHSKPTKIRWNLLESSTGDS